MVDEFQSTRPARGATEIAHKLTDTIKFQSTRPARGATFNRVEIDPFRKISIHAPREGRDTLAPAFFY